MHILNRLRQNSLRRVLLPSILFIALALVIFFAFGCQNLIKTFSPQKLADLDPEKMEGAYVEDDIYYFYTPYLEEEQYKNNRPTGRITGTQYIVDFDDIYYMGLFVHSTDMDEAEAMLEASTAYYYGEIAAEDLPIMHVKGTMTAMSSEELGYYMDSATESPETKDVMLPYYLDVNRIGGSTASALWILSAISLVLILIAIFLFIKAITGGYQKKLKAKLETLGGLEVAGERLDRFYDATEPVSGVRMNQDFVLFDKGAEPVLLQPQELIWAYQSTIQHRIYGIIPSGKSHAVVFRTIDGKMYTLNMKEDAAQTLLEALHQRMPGLIIGYTPELQQLYKENRNAFAAHRQSHETDYPESSDI
ncbi:MAG: hypothetical protein EOM34_01445 [Clostridia bacterium]|nr:hypothetical protein [Clostridia bacterium]NCD01571.1 hypothetical protein [Clostridia bacterium]